MNAAQASSFTDRLLEIQGLCKAFGGVQALDNVSLDVRSGEIHGLCGENGAGKSTLIKILTGVVRPDSGQVLIRGSRLPWSDPHTAEALGIAAMHQESTAFPDLNAVENVFVGREVTRAGGCLLNRAVMRDETERLLTRLGERIDLSIATGDLPLAQRQMVSMARAMSRKCQLLIMDEPTASLSARETEFMLERICQLRDEGVSVLYVSHRLDELFKIADRVTVLRDGQFVATHAISQIDKPRLIQLMVGRELSEVGRDDTRAPPGDVVLEVTGVCREGAFRDISFVVRAGEILGLAGLVGAGRTEIARAIFGVDAYEEGRVLVNGKPLPGCSVAAAMRAGLGLVPEDRQHEGLVLPMPISANITLAVLNRLGPLGYVNRHRERQIVVRQLKALGVKASSPAAPAETLSGGNQQKIVLGKWLAAHPRILILDEPTRGIDVAAKVQVHQIIRGLADQGVATVMISSELPEILALSDRVLVMREGEISREFDGREATQELLLRYALPARTEAIST